MPFYSKCKIIILTNFQILERKIKFETEIINTFLKFSNLSALTSDK